MSKKGYSLPNFWGGYDHYDENGKKIGTSEPSFWGGFDHLDASGKKESTSNPSFLAGYNNNDPKRRTTGTSDPVSFPFQAQNGLHPQPGAVEDRSGSEGCYIATCVYGSYDCPQVWTLRRFRDDTLKQSAAGRAFVRIYYALSPTLVRHFGHTKVFQHFWRGRLDRLVKRLNGRGVEDKQYTGT